MKNIKEACEYQKHTLTETEVVQALDALMAFTKHEKRDEMEAALGERESHTHTQTCTCKHTHTFTLKHMHTDVHVHMYKLMNTEARSMVLQWLTAISAGHNTSLLCYQTVYMYIKLTLGAFLNYITLPMEFRQTSNVCCKSYFRFL